MNRYMSINEVAELYAVHPATIRRWIKNVEGFPRPITPAGKNIKFIRKEIMQFYFNQEG